MMLIDNAHPWCFDSAAPLEDRDDISLSHIVLTLSLSRLTVKPYPSTTKQKSNVTTDRGFLRFKFESAED